MLSFDGKDPPGDPVKKFDEPEGLDPGWRTGTKRIDTDQMSLGLVLSLLESWLDWPKQHKLNMEMLEQLFEVRLMKHWGSSAHVWDLNRLMSLSSLHKLCTSFMMWLTSIPVEFCSVGWSVGCRDCLSSVAWCWSSAICNIKPSCSWRWASTCSAWNSPSIGQLINPTLCMNKLLLGFLVASRNLWATPWTSFFPPLRILHVPNQNISLGPTWRYIGLCFNNRGLCMRLGCDRSCLGWGLNLNGLTY